MVTSTKNRLSDVLPKSEPPVERLARQTTLVPERSRVPVRSSEQLHKDRWTAFWAIAIVVGLMGLIIWLAAMSPHAAENASDLWMFY